MSTVIHLVITSKLSCTPIAHCSFQSFGNGHLLYASLEPLSVEATAALPGGVPGTEGSDGRVWADTIKEVKNGKVVWEWKVSEKLDPAVFPLQAHYSREHWPLINTV